MRLLWLTAAPAGLAAAAAPPGSAPRAPPAQATQILWPDAAEPLRVLTTAATLQVVTNPILDETFSNGKSNPIYDRVWASLRALEADLVRFVPWFPYPKKSVAELAPGRWDFTDIMPQMRAFMANTYSKGHSIILNFSTQPCWMFGQRNPEGGIDPALNKKLCIDRVVGLNPDQSDFSYVTGSRADLLDPSGKQLAGYY